MSDKKHISGFSKGLVKDYSFDNQPLETYSYALNVVNETTEGDIGFLINEQSHELTSYIPNGYVVIGDIYIGNNNTIIFSVFDGISEIGILDEKDLYTTLINTKELHFDEKYPIRGVFRIKKNNERIIYFVDSYNKPRSINIDNLEKYYSIELKEWLDLGKNINDFIGEKWNDVSFNLIKSYEKIPFFNDVDILQNGNIKPGSYSFGILYTDEDLNNTNIISTSNVINIYNDNLTNEYGTIRGSRNIESALMTYGNTNKAIKLSVGNLDENYPFYRVAIIQANNMTGIPNKALLSEIIPTSESSYIYYGNDEQLIEIDLDSIQIDKEDINNVEFIQQLENRLILGKYKSKNINFCSFQKYASKISSHLTTRKVYLNSVNSSGNPKNPNSPFDNSGYMPGEVYSFGIVYIFNDGTLSPVYHIPGRNKKDIRTNVNGFNDNMDYYETPDSKYPEIHKCTNKEAYWGKDNYGDYLTGNPKRFHKFPFRKDRELSLYGKESTTVYIYNYKLILKVRLREGKTFPINNVTKEPILITCKVEYKKEGYDTYNNYSTIITDRSKLETIEEVVYNSDINIQTLSEGYGIISGEILNYADIFDISLIYETEVKEAIKPAYYTNIYGIKFDNIEKPHPDIKGYFIVRNERTNSDKLIIDNALFGPITSYSKNNTNYKVFNKWVNTAQGETVDSSVRDLDSKALYFFSPEHQFKNSTLNFTHINIQGSFDTVKMTSINNGEPSDTGNYATRPYSVVISDTMEGTSYNSEVHATTDSDGFNLIIGYRNSNLINKDNDYDINWSYDEDGNSTIQNIIYLNAASSKLYNGNTYYNACQDNKIGIIEFQNDIFANDDERNLIFGTENTKLYYGSLIVNNKTAYSNFLDRDYFKEHNNPICFDDDGYGNGVSIFNGDAYVNANTLVASTYYGMIMANRKKKEDKSSGILGVALIVVGVAATIFTAGAAIGVFGAISTAAAITLTTIGAMALSAGASMISANLKLENLKKMINEDYPNGLEHAISDKDISDHADDTYPYGCGLKDGTDNSDDAIAWFADRLTDLFIESSVNTGLRTSLTSINIDFINSLNNVANSNYNLADGTKVTASTYVDMTGFDENEFRAYLVEKLTTIDAERGDGRLYRGYANAEWYDINPDFDRKNKEKLFIHLPITYECCSDNDDYSQKYNNRLIYSEQSFQEEQTDNYRVFLPNNYKDLEGECGAITGLWRIENDLYIHTFEGLWRLPQNLQEKVTTSLSTYIGTGEFLAINPQKIESGNINYGSQSDFSTINVYNAVLFINQRSSEIFLYSKQGITDLTNLGMKNWFRENLPLKIKHQLYDLSQYQWRINNPTIGIGVLTGYDKDLNRILITKKDYQFTKTADFQGEFSYDKTDYVKNNIFIKDDKFHIVDSGYYKSIRPIGFDDFEIETNVLINTVQFNIEETFNTVTGRWFNKNSSTYKTIDYGSTSYLTTTTSGIDFTNVNLNKPSTIQNEYINAYFTCKFIPKETKTYNFYTKSKDGSKLYLDYISGGSPTSVLVIDNWLDQDVTLKTGSISLTAGVEYTVRVEYYHGTGTGNLSAGLTLLSENGGIIEFIDTGIIRYTPPTDFEGEDTVNLITNKHTYSTKPESIVFDVKSREGEEETFPYLSSDITTNDSSFYKSVLNFPCTADGTIEFRDKINIPHKIVIEYDDIQIFTINYDNTWYYGKNTLYLFNVVHNGVDDDITITIECEWKNPLNNDSYNKRINYEIDYDLS